MNRIGAASIGVIAASMVLTGCSIAGEPIAQPTAPELAALNATVRDVQWQGLRFSPNAARPTVEFESYTDPDDTTEVYRSCMREAGHEDWTEVNFHALGDAPVTERLDLYVCTSRFPLHPSFYGLYTESQLDAIYDYYEESLVPCMQASGIDVRGVPTRAEFVGNPPAMGSVWSPFNYDYELSDNLWMVIYRDCNDLSYRIGVPPE